ncbi:hypothetical protein LEP1GSC151_0158 [Leptospira interrogans serovar Grippotyphosa str. LT2186]|uniref:Uncharacterized protein n=1 Tax=Leptospira interrogans serovar Grippotyphosa str. LT2186 TaxID=1001599 RepID=M3H731_LEPIR|nr:hypothetical protein LEP1GSC151_0158 [Leptospira interrogans serovar Grippotyphosa str. LT2186]
MLWNFSTTLLHTFVEEEFGQFKNRSSFFVLVLTELYEI